MAAKELQCPTCDADMLLTGDEQAGEEIFCPACMAPAKVTDDPSSEDCEIDADY